VVSLNHLRQRHYGIEETRPAETAFAAACRGRGRIPPRVQDSPTAQRYRLSTDEEPGILHSGRTAVRL